MRFKKGGRKANNRPSFFMLRRRYAKERNRAFLDWVNIFLGFIENHPRGKIPSPSGLIFTQKSDELFMSRVEDSFIAAFLNHENTKRREFHEIFESRISRIFLDFTEKSSLRRDPLRHPFLFSIFFRVFLFHFVLSRFKRRS